MFIGTLLMDKIKQIDFITFLLDLGINYEDTRKIIKRMILNEIQYKINNH